MRIIPNDNDGTYRRALRLTGLIGLLIAIGTLIPLGPPAPPSDTMIDKLVHFAMFWALVLPLCSVRPRHALWLIPVAIAYGGAIELIQPISNRGADWMDWVADILGAGGGAVTGFAIYLLAFRERGRDG